MSPSNSKSPPTRPTRYSFASHSPHGCLCLSHAYLTLVLEVLQSQLLRSLAHHTLDRNTLPQTATGFSPHFLSLHSIDTLWRDLPNPLFSSSSPTLSYSISLLSLTFLQNTYYHLTYYIYWLIISPNWTESSRRARTFSASFTACPQHRDNCLEHGSTTIHVFNEWMNYN